MQPWRLIVDHAQNPYYNMAVDEALLISCSREPRPCLRFYEWEGCAVSIGYFQSVRDIEKSLNIPVPATIVRRPTGGGAVVHTDDITFALVCPESYLPGPVIDSYRSINEHIIRNMEQSDQFRLIPNDHHAHKQNSPRFCFEEPTRYDILWRNIKVGGSAQRRRQGTVLHQSSFFYKKCCDVINSSNPSLRVSFMKIIENAVADLFGATFYSSSLTESETRTARELCTSRYATREWNFSR